MELDGKKEFIQKRKSYLSEVIKSPGIPDSVNIIQDLKLNGIPIISEVEFAYRYTNSKIMQLQVVMEKQQLLCC